MSARTLAPSRDVRQVTDSAGPSAGPVAGVRPRRGRAASAGLLTLGVLLVAGLTGISLFVGVGQLHPATVLHDETQQMLLVQSRVPRTVALLLAGAAMAVAGTIMQLLARNRFTEPSTAGTTEFAGLGIVAATLVVPDAPLIVRMAAASAAALVGSAVFLRIIRGLPTRETLLVPLVGLMLGGVVSAATTFVALRTDLMQSLTSWLTADFSVVIAGRYELLWAAGAVTLLAYLAADRFTVAGLGEDVTTSLGLDYRAVMGLGLAIVSVVTAVVVVTVGAVPFIGLVVPNLVALWVGDHARRSLVWTALGGMAFVLLSDLVARTVVAPAEIPLGTVVGVVGAGLFLALLGRQVVRAR